jgi:organic radical activating enzyme
MFVTDMVRTLPAVVGIESRDYLYSEKYLDLMLENIHIDRLTFEVGPYCNLNCAHCYANCTSRAKRKLNVKTIQKASDDIDEQDFKVLFGRVLLTDGEPLLSINRRSLRRVIECFPESSIEINTNGSFARTQDNAKKWFEWLREQGYDIEGQKDSFNVSASGMYPFTPKQHERIARALVTVNPQLKFGKNNFQYTFVSEPNCGDEEYDFYSKLHYMWLEVFGFDPELEKKEAEKVEYANKHHYFVPTQRGQFRITRGFISPLGRARKIIPKETQIKPIKPMADYVPYAEGVWVGSNGDVALATTKFNFRPGLVFGNVNKESLIEIIKRIVNGQFYKARKLGQSPFLYWTLGQIDSNVRKPRRFYIEYSDIVYSRKAVRAIEDYYSTHDVKAEFHRFLDEELANN